MGCNCLRTSVAGARARKLIPRVCTLTLPFAHICCRRVRLPTRPARLRLIIRTHLLQVRAPASSTHAPAPAYLLSSLQAHAARLRPVICHAFWPQCRQHDFVSRLRRPYSNAYIQKRAPLGIQDFPLQRVTAATMPTCLRLSSSQALRQFVYAIAWSEETR